MISVLVYLFVMIMTLIAAGLCFKTSKNNIDFSASTGCRRKHASAPWINILLISFILGMFSKCLDYIGVLSDRERYSFSFIYRYPMYFGSIDALFKAGTEPGFVLLCRIFSSFTQNMSWLYFFTVFISSIINLYVISKITKHFISVTVLTLISMFAFQSTFLIRQSLAVAFINLAMLEYLNKKRWHCIFYTVIAYMFHSTAIIMIPIFLLFFVIKSRRMYLIFPVIFLIMILNLNTILIHVLELPYIGQYIQLEGLEYSTEGIYAASMLKGIPYYMITFLYLIYRKKLKKLTAYADIFITASILNTMSWLLTAYMYWFYRIGWYLMLPSLILVPMLFQCLKEEKGSLIIFVLSIVLMMLLTLRQVIVIL